MTHHVQIHDHGSVVLLQPTTPEARDWLDEHLCTEPWQYLGDSIAVEPRYVGDILTGLRDDGFTFGVDS